MPAPLSMDLRRRMVEAVEEGSSIRAAARRFAVSASAAIKLMQRVRATGSPAPERDSGYRRPVLEPDRADLERLVALEPDLTPAELRDRLQRRCQLPCTTAAPTGPQAPKKSLRAAEQDRPDVAAKRRRWRGWQGFMDPARFVFLDETGTATNMARRDGRCPASERLVAAVPHGHWYATTFVAGLRQSGITAPPREPPRRRADPALRPPRLF